MIQDDGSCTCGFPRGFVCGKRTCWRVKKVDASLNRAAFMLLGQLAARTYQAPTDDSRSDSQFMVPDLRGHFRRIRDVPRHERIDERSQINEA